MDEPLYLATLEYRDTDTAEVEREYLVCLQQPDLLLLEHGSQGPPGPPGPDGGSALQRPAGETLSALRVVYELAGAVFALDYRDAEHIDLVVGVTLTAAAQGGAVNIQRSGTLDDAAWSWQPGPVWLGAAGALTQSPPTDGFDLLIGSAVSATRITLNIQDPIDLE